MKSLLLLACLLVSSLLAQQNGSIEGRVTNSQTGEGVSGATLHLNSMGTRSPGAPGGSGGTATATSAADGTFRFDNVAQGFYYISAECTGYAAMHIIGNKGIEVDPGQQVTDAGIQLDPEGRLSGKVVDEDGNPVARADIEALSTYKLRGRVQLRRAAVGETDENGNFALKDLSPGKYYLAAAPRVQKHSEKSETPDKFDLVRTYFPQALDFESASLLDVAPAQNLTDLTIRMGRAATYHVRGRVQGMQVTSKGKGPEIRLGPREDAESASMGRSVTVAPDGTFDIDNVQTGTYTLRMTGVDPDAAALGGRALRGNRVLARADVQVGTADVNGVVLAMLPPVAMTGHVTVENANGASVNCSQTRVNVSPAEDVSFSAFASAEVKPDGTLSFPGLDPGRYYVHASNVPRGTYVKSILFNQQDLGNGVLDITQGGAGTLDVVLRQGVAEVDGTVAASSSTSTARIGPNDTVILVPENLSGDGQGLLIGGAAPGSSFAIHNVPPGRYRAFAIERWESSLWQNPDFLHALTSEGTTVDVEENGSAQLQLPLTTSDQLQQIVARYGISPQ